ncbi:MAG: glycosyltransferase family 9 protein [Rhodospirillales bacterium]|nr:glycosyltransferase family 9 protein [Rhodospirillales bacterium]
MIEKVLVSRCDRLGDLVLSLPAAALVQQAGFDVTLHCSSYARDVAFWGLANGLYREVWVAGQTPPAGLDRDTWGLALYDSKITMEAFRHLRLRRRFGPYSKLPSYLHYDKGLRQRRSRVAKSEMAYNLDLVRGLIAWAGGEAPVFRPLPALRVPADWQAPRPSPDWVAVLSSGGSAKNWPVADYLAWLSDHRKAGDSLDFLVQGVDAQARRQALQDSGILQESGVGLVEGFDSVRHLIAYLAGAGQILSSSTGPLHIAHAAGVPVYGLYPEAPLVETFARWKPDGYGHGVPVTKIAITG